MIKKIIMNWVRDYVDNQLEKQEENLFKIYNLQKKSDKEIIKEYKHTKFKDVSSLEFKYLTNRYGLKLLNHFGFPPFDKYLISKNDYISDEIEISLLKKPVIQPITNSEKTVKKTKKTKKDQTI